MTQRPPRSPSGWTPKSSAACATRPAYRPPQPRHTGPAERLSAVADGPERTGPQSRRPRTDRPGRLQPATGGGVIMKATSMSPRSGQRAASGNAVVLLHGHQLERNLARAVTAEAAGTFALVLAIPSTAVAATLSRPVAGPPSRPLAVPVAGGVGVGTGGRSV